MPVTIQYYHIKINCMKKNLFTVSTIIFTCVILAGCNKEIKETKINAQNQVSLSKSLNSCRLILNHSDFGDESYTYNENGLTNIWTIDNYGGYFKQEYN